MIVDRRNQSKSHRQVGGTLIPQIQQRCKHKDTFMCKVRHTLITFNQFPGEYGYLLRMHHEFLGVMVAKMS